MGYTAHRRRGESALSDIDIIAGGGHAGWPVMMAYGDSDSLVNGTVQNGDWGFYHEIGHTYQDSFEGGYVIATHGEVCVNLVPALLYTHVHDRTSWDGNVHSTFNGQGRLNDRVAFGNLSTADQTWSQACNNRPMAYDFYFNLAEAFGWDMYHKALGRLITWHRGGADSALDLTGGRTNFGGQNKRDRTYIIFSDAIGRNLDAYFQRYGLGAPGRGFEISNTAKNHIAGKGYPEWIENSPVQEITDPGPIDALDSLPVGAPLATLEANDPTEPGTIWDWEILNGGDGRIVIDQRAGILRVGPLGLDGNATPVHHLTVRARETTVPRFETQRTITVEAAPRPKAPRAASFDVLHATNAMAAGTILGTVLTTDTGRTLASVEILNGNPGGNAFALDMQGRLIIQTPASIPAASVVRLAIRGTDDNGVSGTAAVRVLCNANRGLREQRWSGQSAFWDQDWTAAPSFDGHIHTSTTAQNVGDQYSRRVTGWVVAPQTGRYTFWVASDDQSRLFLGTDASAFSRIQRASVSGWTSFQNFDANSSQRSVAMHLVAGQAYWIEAHQAEGGGADHLSIAWSKPDGSARQVIPTQHLIPNQHGLSVSGNFPLAPVFPNLTLEVQDAEHDQPYTGTAAGAALHPAGESLTYTITHGPSWLTIAPDGMFSGTPSFSDIGHHQWTIRASTADGLWAETTLSMNVTAPDPFAMLTAPANGGEIVLGTMVQLSAIAAAGDFVAERVDFLLNDDVIGSSANAPYQVDWIPTQPGLGNLSARLIHRGGQVDSPQVAIWVTHGHPVFINPDGGGWEVPENWLHEVIADGEDVIADFSLLKLDGEVPIVLDTGRTLGGLRFGDRGDAHPWHLTTGGGTTLTLRATETPVIHAASPGAQVSAILAGTQGFLKSGPGHLTLTASNSWSGLARVAEGTLEVRAKSGDVPYLVEAGASLIFGYNSGTGYSPSVTVRGDGIDSPAGLFISPNRTLAANDGIRLEQAPSRIRVHGLGTAAIRGFDLHSPHHLRVAAAASGSMIESTIAINTGSWGYRLFVEDGEHTETGDVQIHGPIIGNGNANISTTQIPTSLLKTGPGSARLSGQSTFAAGTSIAHGTLILAEGENRLPPTSALALGSGNLSGHLQLGDAAGPVRQSLGDLLTHGNGTDNAVVGGHFEYSELELILNADRIFTGRFGGASPHANHLAITKSGSAALTLSSHHSHLGATTIQQGTLQLDGVLEHSPLIIAANASLTGSGSAHNRVDVFGKLDVSSGFTIGGALAIHSGAIMDLSMALDEHALQAHSLHFANTAADPIVITLSGGGMPAEFANGLETIPLIRTVDGITGYDPSSIDINATWASELQGDLHITVSGNDLVLGYTPADSYGNWAAEWFGDDANDAGIADPLADPDGDGIPNLMEFALGLSPIVAGSTHEKVHTQRTHIDGQEWFTLVIHRNPAAADLEFIVEGTTHLTDAHGWSTEAIEIIENTPERIIARDTSGAPQRFLRLRVMPPGS